MTTKTPFAAAKFALVFSILAVVALVLMEERPRTGPAWMAPPVASAAPPAPAE